MPETLLYSWGIERWTETHNSDTSYKIAFQDSGRLTGWSLILTGSYGSREYVRKIYRWEANKFGHLYNVQPGLNLAGGGGAVRSSWVRETIYFLRFFEFGVHSFTDTSWCYSHRFQMGWRCRELFSIQFETYISSINVVSLWKLQSCKGREGQFVTWIVSAMD